MADTAYDADHPRQAIAARWALAVTPNNPSRALKYLLDKYLYAVLPSGRYLRTTRDQVRSGDARQLVRPRLLPSPARR